MLKTTVVGSYPKPLWLSNPFGAFFGGWRLETKVLREGQDDATLLAIGDQERAGIDVVSDGEQRRDNFVYYFTRRLKGFDFNRLARKRLRGNNREFDAPRIVDAIERSGPIAVDDVRFLRAATRRGIRMAVPGPMTIVDTSHDQHYGGDERALAMDLATAINLELKDWERAGCDIVQVDEPAFTRYPERVRDWGIEALNRCFDGIGAKTTVHVCYGYPIDGPKVREHGYEVLLPFLNESRVDQISLECAAPRLDPSVVKLCGHKEVLFGLIDIGSRHAENPAELARRIREALRYITPDRLWLAPDCGLVLLDRSLARAKLRALSEAARIARGEIGLGATAIEEEVP
jgi:5-methyltetrahydropteroyltriglutamate--homocysteine methyltransferase